MAKKAAVARNVKELATVFPEVKRDYNTLVLYYWTIFDGVNDVEAIHEATPLSTITRAFRRLVAVGEIEMPDELRKIKKEKEREFRQEFSSLI